jgi:hypothetical protein
MKKRILNAIEIVKNSYDYPVCAWETPYAAALGKLKLLRILRYLARPERYEYPKNRKYRTNRTMGKVNLW